MTPTQPPPALAHRPDIDGLRAVAVIPVVLFHAGLPLTSGGFVGVDVFFVISGYLITSILVRELGRGSFSIAGFYERRVRRIFPALFTVLAASLILALLLFLPRELAEFSRSLAGAALFVSNVVFWQEVDYFGITADLKPLLHTWSLAIEEQFYIVFPVALAALYRFAGGRWRAFVGIVLLISLGLCLWGTGRYPVATFYLAPTRAWELMIGSLLAGGVVPSPKGQAGREALALSGIGLILASVVWLDGDTAFPGAYALAPCLGAAFVIVAGMEGTSWTARLLSLRPVVFVGLISYSLYLWHWPLLVFAKYWRVRELEPAETGAIVLLSGVLAALSWRFVEQPFRTRPFRVARRPLFVGASVAMSALAVAGIGVSLQGGLPGRLAPEALAWARQADPPARYAHCRSQRPDHVPLCRIGADAAPESFLVWGDSHAMAVLPGIEEAARRLGRAGVVATRAGCGPLLGARSVRSPEGCPRFNEEVARALAARPELETVILAGYWRRMATASSYDADGQFYVDEASSEHSAAETGRVFARSLERIFVRFPERRFRVVADAPEARRNVPNALARLAHFGRQPGDWAGSVPLAPHLAAQAEARAIFASFGSRYDLTVVEVADLLCPDGSCPLTLDGQVVYRDGDHLSDFGAMLLTDRFAAALARPRSP